MWVKYLMDELSSCLGADEGNATARVVEDVKDDSPLSDATLLHVLGFASLGSIVAMRGTCRKLHRLSNECQGQRCRRQRCLVAMAGHSTYMLSLDDKEWLPLPGAPLGRVESLTPTSTGFIAYGDMHRRCDALVHFHAKASADIKFTSYYFFILIF